MSKVNSNFIKARNVMFIVYLEDWGKSYGELLEYLDGLPVRCACSPIHEKDNPYRKTHCHCFICAGCAHSSDWFHDLMLPFHDVTYFDKIQSVEFMRPYYQLRYFGKKVIVNGKGK